MISCCEQFITDLVVRKIKENQFFSILADEASDCSNQEIVVDKVMTELQQFLDMLMSYLQIFVKLTVKRYIHTAIATTLI